VKLDLGLQLKFDTLVHNRMGCMGIFYIFLLSIFLDVPIVAMFARC